MSITSRACKSCKDTDDYQKAKGQAKVKDLKKGENKQRGPRGNEKSTTERTGVKWSFKKVSCNCKWELNYSDGSETEGMRMRCRMRMS